MFGQATDAGNSPFLSREQAARLSYSHSALCVLVDASLLVRGPSCELLASSDVILAQFSLVSDSEGYSFTINRKFSFEL